MRLYYVVWCSRQFPPKYEITIAGEVRLFPQKKLLLGAESILARMVYEQQNDTHTAIGLHAKKKASPGSTKLKRVGDEARDAVTATLGVGLHRLPGRGEVRDHPDRDRQRARRFQLRGVVRATGEGTTAEDGPTSPVLGCVLMENRHRPPLHGRLRHDHEGDHAGQSSASGRLSREMPAAEKKKGATPGYYSQTWRGNGKKGKGKGQTLGYWEGQVA